MPTYPTPSFPRPQMKPFPRVILAATPQTAVTVAFVLKNPAINHTSTAYA